MRPRYVGQPEYCSFQDDTRLRARNFDCGTEGSEIAGGADRCAWRCEASQLLLASHLERGVIQARMRRNGRLLIGRHRREGRGWVARGGKRMPGEAGDMTRRRLDLVSSEIRRLHARDCALSS